MTRRNDLSGGSLPRLLYVGDVPVESSYHGSALLYRLLQEYPPDRLRVVEGNLRTSLPQRRLCGVAYGAIRIGWARPLHTRLHRWVRLGYSLAARWRTGAVRRALEGFQPEAVLTVTHEFLWITAASCAWRFQLPLHLVCHDDWPGLAATPKMFHAWINRAFGRVYRQADSRFCVSPYMAEQYERRYGVRGTLLYPARAADAPRFSAPPPRLLENSRPLTLAFAGTINAAGYIDCLQRVAERLQRRGGRLLIFGPLDESGAAAAGLNLGNVELRGLVPSEELMKRLRAEADGLLVPMSFAPEDREYSALSFPSKLTDYTAAGLPLLVYGPEYCSAVRWARDNAGVAEVVTEEDPLALDVSLGRLGEPAHRKALAENTLRTGAKFFSHAAAQQVFYSRLAHGAAD